MGGGSFLAEMDINRNRLSADENVQQRGPAFMLLQPKTFSQHQTFVEFELTRK